MLSLVRDEPTRHLSQRSNQNTSVSRFTLWKDNSPSIVMISISKAPARVASTENLFPLLTLKTDEESAYQREYSRWVNAWRRRF
jgi:hypothetical protein